MIIYRNKHGSFKGGLFKTKISPTITIASFEHNTFIVKIKECATKLPTIKTTIDKSNMTFVTIMNKQIIHTAPNGKKYSIQIRKYTPRDCFRLMGVHEADIDKLLSKEKSGASIICKSKLYALAGNSIVTNCLTAMFEELIFPSGNHYHDKTGQLSLF